MSASLASVGWPVLDRFRFGDSFAISPHGLGIAVGFMVGAWLFTKLAVRRGVPVEAANSVVFWSLIGAVVGARVAYVIAHVSEFESPLEWVQIWKGGISLLGGIAGATIANAVNIKRQAYRFRFFQIADAIVPGLALGISVGRIGDLIIGDHLGKPTSWLLAWTFEGGTLAPPFSCTPEIADTGGRCTAALQGTFTQTIDRTEAVLRTEARSSLAGSASTRRPCTTCSSPASCSRSCGGSSAPPAGRVSPRSCSLCRTDASGCSRTRSGSTSASGPSPGPSGRHSRWPSSRRGS